MTQCEIMAGAACYVCLGLSLPEAIRMVLLNEISANIAPDGGGEGITWGPDVSVLTSIDVSQILAGSNDQTSMTIGVSTLLGSLSAGTKPALESFSAPLLETVGTFLDFEDLASLTELDFPLLKTIGGGLTLSALTALTSLSFPMLSSTGGAFIAPDNTVLASVNLPVWVPSDGTGINFRNDALNAASVAIILRRCVLAGVTTCTIDLSGGTNAGLASLSVQGQADAATLGIVPAPGAQVTINP